MARIEYQVRVVGPVGAAAREAFADVDVHVEQTTTVLSGNLDQPALYGLFEHIRSFGLELIEIHRR
jgi:hypothetical protein